MTGVDVETTEADAPAPGEVLAQLERILGSAAFQMPARARRFLEFVVNETLEGRRDYLKAFTIAQEVFGRDTSFDSQNDPCVRIEAGRLRRELERYYLLAGANDPVIIVIPKGGYVPSFEFNDNASSKFDAEEHQQASHATTPAVGIFSPEALIEEAGATIPRRISWYRPVAAVATLASFLMLTAALPRIMSPSSLEPGSASAEKPTVVVQRFDTVSDGPMVSNISQGITDEIINQLVPFKDIIVLSERPPHLAGNAPTEALFVLQGSVRVEADKLRAFARLVRRNDGAVIWANNYSVDLSEQSMLQTEAALAENIVSAVAHPLGVMSQTGTAKIAAVGKTAPALSDITSLAIK